MHGIPLESVISVWRMAEQLFHNCEYLGLSITIDATDILLLLRLVSADSQKPIDDRLKIRSARGLPPFGSQLIIKTSHPAAVRPRDEMISHFLENLYLAMNISVPGSCNLYDASFKSTRRLERYGWRHRREPVRTSLSAQPFETAWNFSVDRGWPSHREIDLRQTWTWFQRSGLLALDVAEEPWQRAVFTLLRIGQLESHYPDVIFFCVQAIEAIIGQGAPASVTKRRVESVLGVPSSQKNWYSDLQSIRSQVAHGTAPLARSERTSIGHDGKEGSKQFEQIDLSVAVLLGVVQTLIVNDATHFKVSEIIEAG